MALNPIYIAIVFAAISVFVVWCVFKYAQRLSTPALPPRDIVPSTDPSTIDAPPGNTHVLQSGTMSDDQFWVVAANTKWAQTHAANACFRARNAHRMIVAKYSALPVAQRTSWVPGADKLPDTLWTLTWVSAATDPPEPPTSVAGTTFIYVPPDTPDMEQFVAQALAQVLSVPGTAPVDLTYLVSARSSQ